MPYPSLHSAFQNPIDLSHKFVEKMGVLTSEKAKDKFSNMRAKLNVIKSNWEASGVGEGSRIHSQNDEGAEDDVLDLELGALDDRQAFLGTGSPSLLYLWQRSDELDVLSTVLQRISVEHSLESGRAAPTLLLSATSSTNETKRKREENDNQFLISMANDVKQSNKIMKETAIMTRISHLESLRQEMFRDRDSVEDRLEVRPNSERLNCKLNELTRAIDQNKEEIDNLWEELESMNETE
jgi:hypothetical protein